MTKCILASVNRETTKKMKW